MIEKSRWDTIEGERIGKGKGVGENRSRIAQNCTTLLKIQNKNVDTDE